jgi:hypothetical protein
MKKQSIGTIPVKNIIYTLTGLVCRLSIFDFSKDMLQIGDSVQ